jgi:hypothetical protein
MSEKTNPVLVANDQLDSVMGGERKEYTTPCVNGPLWTVERPIPADIPDCEGCQHRMPNPNYVQGGRPKYICIRP